MTITKNQNRRHTRTALRILTGFLSLNVAAGEMVNAVRNGSFEPTSGNARTPKDWKLYGQGALVDGGHSGKCVMVKGKWSSYNQTVPLRANTEYKVSCWIKGRRRI